MLEKIHFIIIAFLLSILFPAAGLVSYVDAVSFNTYYNSDYRFSIDYPAGWIVDDTIMWEDNWVNVVGYVGAG